MGADSTLVNMSLKEAISRSGLNVPNLKPLYDSSVGVTKTVGGVITGLISNIKEVNKKMRIGRDKQIAAFQKIADVGFQKLYSQKQPMPEKIVNALRDRIKELKEEFELYNTYGKNDTEENNNARMKLMGELQRAVSEVVNVRSDFQTILGTAGNWNKERINPANISTYQSFLDVDGIDANNDVTVDYIGGKFTFINSATGQQFTTTEMKEGIPVMDKKMKTYGTDRFISAQQKGATDGKNSSFAYYDNESVITSVRGGYLDEIVDEEDFMNASTIELASGTGTFKNDLLDHAEISLELVKNMYYTENGESVPVGEVFSKWDMDDDGDVDSKDVAAINKLSPAEIEAFNVNHKRIVSALTNRYDPAFNLETSKELFADWAVDKEKQHYSNHYKSNYTPPEGSNTNNDEVVDVWAGTPGLQGNAYNPAIDEFKYVGRKRENGKLRPEGAWNMNGDVTELYKAGKEFKDIFNNVYKPDIVDRDGRVSLWKIIKAGSGDLAVNPKTGGTQWNNDKVAQNVFGTAGKAKIKTEIDNSKI